MHSVVNPASLEAALDDALRRFDGASPVTAQVHHQLGIDRAAQEARGRFRMRLVLEVAAEEGAPAESALDFACAVEMVHQAALIHDDIAAGMHERATRATIWRHFGLAHGINSGDALAALAYLHVLTPSARSAAETVRATRILHQATYAMCAGRAREIALSGTTAEIADVVAMIDARDAALFGAACELGALAAKAGDRAAAYERLGRSCGLAMQLERDLSGRDPDRFRLRDAAAEAARAAFARADDVANEAGIDPSGRVRRLFGDRARRAL
jgi:geranylgeranyl diphosphate synthase type I